MTDREWEGPLVRRPSGGGWDSTVLRCHLVVDPQTTTGLSSKGPLGNIFMRSLSTFATPIHKLCIAHECLLYHNHQCKFFFPKFEMCTYEKGVPTVHKHPLSWTTVQNNQGHTRCRISWMLLYDKLANALDIILSPLSLSSGDGCFTRWAFGIRTIIIIHHHLSLSFPKTEYILHQRRVHQPVHSTQ